MYFDFDADTHMTDDPEEVSGFGAINPSNNPNIDEYSRFPSRQQMKNVLTFAKLLEIIDHYCELQDRLVDDEIAEDFQLSNLRMIVNEFIETFDEISHYDDDIYEWEITHHIVECMFSLGHECGSWPIGDKLFNYAFSNQAVLIVLYLIEVGAPINVDRTIYLKEFIDAPLFRHLCDVTEININSECLEGSHCIDQQVEALFKTFMNLKLPVGITVEQVAASCSPKIKYLLRDIPINTFGIASFFEKDWKSFCYELEPSYSLSLQRAGNYGYLRKELLRNLFQSSANFASPFVIQSYFADYLSFSWMQFMFGKTLRYKGKEIFPWLTVSELEYIFEHILAYEWSTTPQRVIAARTETFDTCPLFCSGKLDFQTWPDDHIHCGLIVPYNEREIQNDQRELQTEPTLHLPSIDILLLAVDPFDIDCFKYLIEKLNLNPNVYFHVKPRPIRKNDSSLDSSRSYDSILLKPLPLRTLRYLIEEGGASVKLLNENVFEGKSNLLFYIIIFWESWLRILVTENELLAVIKYLVEEQMVLDEADISSAIDEIVRRKAPFMLADYFRNLMLATSPMKRAKR